MKLRQVDSLSEFLEIKEDMTIGIAMADCCCQELSEEFFINFTQELTKLSADVKKINIIFSVSGTSTYFLKYLSELKIEGKEIWLTAYCDMSEVYEDELDCAKLNLNFITKNDIPIEFFYENLIDCNEKETVIKKADVLILLAITNFDIKSYINSAKENKKTFVLYFSVVL